MQIASDTVVAIEYTLTDDDGNVIDSSDGGEPLFYLHGHQNIVEGLEEALEGHKVGDSLKVSVSPEKGYGTRDPDLVFDVPRDQLPGEVEPEIGMELEMSDEDGMTIPVRISKVEADSVEVDANHELADQTLHFSVTVREVRRATAPELQHGHVHGPGGHHHH
jgi:FKBP-type peptidyl-prolyl cis-trans isomerase SlyD